MALRTEARDRRSEQSEKNPRGRWRRSARHGGVIAGAMVVATLGACGSSVRPELGRAYPAFTEQAETLNVQVVRDETHVTFTNTTASPLGPGRVWLNQAYSLPLGLVGVGETVTLDLREFRNEFGEPFRAGGFFATKTPKAVVIMQVQEGSAAFTGEEAALESSPAEPVELLGLVVVRGEVERR